MAASFKTILLYIAVFSAALISNGTDTKAAVQLQDNVDDDDNGGPGDTPLPPEPRPGFYKFLENCGKTLDVGCSDDIFIVLFNRTDINRYCCGEIMEMGKKCHDAFVSTLVRIEKYKEFWSVLPKRGEWLWNYCHKIGGEKRREEPVPPVRTGGKKPPSPGKNGKTPGKDRKKGAPAPEKGSKDRKDRKKGAPAPEK